jgi:peptidoglycan/LPS O-acetylase OafA/YrhL
MSIKSTVPITSHFKPLDGLRGIAIILVIFVHSFKYEGNSLFGRGLNIVARSGWVGVTLFFVLSGFLITGILLDTKYKRHYFRDFFVRRSLRIFPLYFLFLLLYFFVAPHVFSPAQLPQPIPEDRIYYWFYLSNMKEWLSGAANSIPALDPLWSLAVEEQVYLFWPFLIRFVPNRRLLVVLVGIMIFSFGWRFATRLTAASISLSYGWAPANLEAFAAGGIVAWLSRESGGLLKRWAPRFVLASISFILGMWVGQRHFNFWEAPVQMLTLGISGLSICFSSLIAYSVTSEDRSLLNRLLASSWLRWIGKYSYAIYLFHSVIIELLIPIFFPAKDNIIQGQDLSKSLILTGLTLLFSCGLACLSWYAWESQFLRLKKYFPSSGRVVRL